MIDALLQDVRYAARDLRSAPLFTSIAALTLAVGIGAATAVFSAVDATLLRPLPYSEPTALVDVRTRYADGRATTGLVASAELNALNRRSDVVRRAAGVYATPIDATLLGDGGTPLRIAVAGVTHGYFETLGLPLAVGRSFTLEEHQSPGPEAQIHLVLSSRMWTTTFGQARNIVGRPVRIAELRGAATVIGVASPVLDAPGSPDAWFNTRLDPDEGSHVFKGVVRLQNGRSLADLVAVAPAVMAEVARTVPNAVGRDFALQSLLSAVVGPLETILLIVWVATALLLLLACINVTNLVLAQGVARYYDAAMRSALGASPQRLFQQQLVQATLLATIGAAGGVVVAQGAVRVFRAAGAAALPRLDALAVDTRVLLFVVAVTFVTGVISGVVPSFRLSRANGRTLIQQGGSRTTAGAAAARLMSGLVVAEIALALALVAGAGWLVQSYDRLRAIDRGFVSEGRIVVDVRPALPSRDAASVDPWVERVLSEVRAAVPDGTVGSAWTYPLRSDNDGTTNVQVESDEASPDRPQTSHARAVSAGLLEAMGVRLVAGRLFTADDRRDSERVVVVTRSFAAQVLGGRDPLRTRIGVGYPQPNMGQLARIVGVVEDVRYASPTSAPEPLYYVPVTQVFPMQRQSIVVASAQTPPAVLIERVRAALVRVDPTLIVEAAPATRFVDAATREQQLGQMMMLGFGAAALLLAAVGVYGVIGYIASMRQRELATRVALGATSAQILWLMLGSARRSALLGGLVGLLLAYAGGHILASRVFGVSPGDAGVLAGAWVAVSVVALAAAAVPALRASRADPLRALRAD